MANKLVTPANWGTYAAFDKGMTHYVKLSEVIAVKYPDEITGGVTLRLSNGQFASLALTEQLDDVLNDLRITNNPTDA